MLFVHLNFQLLNKIVREEIEKFLERAEVFERDARHDTQNKNFDVALFHLEQAAQLLIKSSYLYEEFFEEEVEEAFRFLKELRGLLWKG